MSESRMNGLVLLYTHRDMEVNLNFLMQLDIEELDHSINFFYRLNIKLPFASVNIFSRYAPAKVLLLNIKLPFASVNIFSRYASAKVLLLKVFDSNIIFYSSILLNRSSIIIINC